ncbi:cation:proton antiporter [Alkalihalobacillus deserti]|uniref:cation:proton antiporter n=1 Tax=Alkalihalobacillus deserti TaxID=2879466 RepID=UPI001D14416F|nr:sodium:proton antiporter [Alkalihalobacillus deserti]
MSCVESVLFSIILVIVLGITSQWLAWRIQWPAIVLMSIAGLIVGPALGLLNPEQQLGDLYTPIISLAVAIILFEGSLSLDLREIRGISHSVIRMVTLGAFLAWMGGTIAAHYVAGLDWEVSFIIGGLFIVTGPTVIIPLLRQAKLRPRVATVLKWEGIIVDPVGVLVALFAYEIVKVITHESIHANYLLLFFGGALFATVLGLAFGLAISYAIEKGKIPEYLTAPVLLGLVILCFGICEAVIHETGLLGVTVMGVTLAQTKKYVSSIGEIRHFKENISVLLTSTVFIMLTASLSRETIIEIFSWPIISFVLMMLFIVRPVSIWLSTIGTELTIQEKTLVAWIAPRGIVAITVASYFASLLLKDGYADASLLVTLTFALIFITVCAHGFSIGYLSKKLGLASSEPPGILIVGSSKFSIAFAQFCNKLGIPTLLTDSSEEHIQEATKLGLNTFHGEVLSEKTQLTADFSQYEYFFIASDTFTYNALVFSTYALQFGHANMFLLPTSMSNHHKDDLPPYMRSHFLFGPNEVYQQLNWKIDNGYVFKSINIHEKHLIDRTELDKDQTALFVRHASGKLTFATLKTQLVAEAGDQLIVFQSPKSSRPVLKETFKNGGC